MSSIYKTNKPLVLASGSPRRKEFLHSLGLPFTICTVPCSEPAPLLNEIPKDFAIRAATAKTLAVVEERQKALHDHVVIGADTIVVLGNEIMGKPRDDEHALDMLSRLAGNTHEVITGVCLAFPHDECVIGEQSVMAFAVSTKVKMAAQSTEVLKAYIQTREPDDKAGAYAIQGIGAFLVQSIEGSWSNVVGLPLVQVVETLMERGVVVPAQS